MVVTRDCFIFLILVFFSKTFGYYCLAGRYVAPEVFKNEEYDTKIDVFSFSLIVQEVRS